MEQSQRVKYYLTAALLFLFFTYPMLTAANKQVMVLGIPLLYFYIGVVWLLGIVALYFIANKSRK
ncbi:MAG: hypothetical protein QM642_04815 [Edaphocola sp.]